MKPFFLPFASFSPVIWNIEDNSFFFSFSFVLVFFSFPSESLSSKKTKKRCNQDFRNSTPKLNLKFFAVLSSLLSKVTCVQELESFARIFRLLCCYDNGEDWTKTITCGPVYQTMGWKTVVSQGGSRNMGWYIGVVHRCWQSFNCGCKL